MYYTRCHQCTFLFSYHNYHIAESFGEYKAKLHLAKNKKTLTNLNQVLTRNRWIKLWWIHSKSPKFPLYNIVFLLSRSLKLYTSNYMWNILFNITTSFQLAPYFCDFDLHNSWFISLCEYIETPSSVRKPVRYTMDILTGNAIFMHA